MFVKFYIFDSWSKMPKTFFMLQSGEVLNSAEFVNRQSLLESREQSTTTPMPKRVKIIIHAGQLFQRYNCSIFRFFCQSYLRVMLLQKSREAVLEFQRRPKKTKKRKLS